MNVALRTIDGRPVLCLERRLAHPPEKVWRALTEAAHLSQWYPFQVAEMELRVGGRIRFDDGAGTTLDATITELDPPRVFAFSEHAPAEMVRESDDLVCFELRPDGDGCLLVFTHTFDDRPAAASYATGWHGCLDAMEMVMDGRPVEWAQDDMAERHEAYVEAFGLNQGTAEVTEGGWRVRFERQLMQQPIEKVWAALTAAVPGSGGPVVGGSAPSACTTHNVVPGAVTAVEAPAVLEFDWLFEKRSVGRVRWELSNGPGGARIVLTQVGPSELADERPAALTAWRTHLDILAGQLREASW